MHDAARMGCGELISSVGGGKEYAAGIALTLASPQQFVSGRQWNIV